MPLELPQSKGAYKPSDIAPQEHDEKWYLQWSRYIYSMYRDNRCMVNPSGFRFDSPEQIEDLRAYARGKQDPDKYKRILDKQIKLDDNSNAGILNISWRIPYIYPTYRQRIIDRIMELKYEPTVIAIDEPSIEKKERAYLRDKIAAMPDAKALMAASGVMPDNITDNALVMSQEEIDQYKSLGGYSLMAEIALTEAVSATLDLNRFFPAVYRQVVEDLVDLGFAHVEVSHNPGDRVQQIKYIDPEFAVIPTSKYDDCRDVTWGGFLEETSLANLRFESGFDEQTLAEVARTYRQHMGNEKYNWNGMQGRQAHSASDGVAYDRFAVCVMTAYFIAAEAESFIAGIHASGSRVFDPVKPGTKLGPGAADKGFRVVNTTVQNVYKVKWIVGTDYVYQCGINDVVVRDGIPGDMKALFPIVTYRTNQMSMTEACMPTIDDLCINVFKKRHIISKMPPAPNIAVNVSALEQATSLGNMRLMPQDLIDIYTVKGVLFLAGDQDYGEPFQNGSPPKPIVELPNTTLDQLRTIQIDLEMCMNQLRQTTGVNEIADGTSVKSGMLNGVTESYNQSANRALSWLYTANESVQTNVMLQLAKRYQVICGKGKFSVKHIPVGADTMQTITLLPEFSLCDFQVVVRPGIDEVAKQALLQSITTYKMNAQISPADEMAVVTFLARGQHRKAQFFLASAVARKAKMDAILAQQNASAQAQAQGQAGVMVEQAKQQSMAMKAELDSKTLQLEYQLKNDFADRDVPRQIQINASEQITGAAVGQVVQPAA